MPTPAEGGARPTTPAFLRLDSQVGWRRAALPEGEAPGRERERLLAEDAGLGGLRLGNEAQPPIPYTEPGGTFGGLTRPTGLAVGVEGRLFLADPGGSQILMATTHTQGFVPLWRPAPAAPGAACDLPDTVAPGGYTLRAPRGVAWGPEGELVVADTGHGRLIFYLWPELLPRRILSVAGEPWDVAFDSRGRLYAADPVAQRVWRWERHGQWDEAWHGGLGQLQRPRHLAIDSADRVYVLDEGATPPRVVALTARGRVEDGWTVAALHKVTLPPPLQLEGETLLLPQEGRAECPTLPLPGLQLDRLGRLVGVGAMVAAQPVGVSVPRVGVFRTGALDSGLFHCAWHRVLLDADIPPTTSLTVRTMTDAAPLDDARLGEVPASRWSPPITLAPGDTPELLVQSGPGRYLWLEVELTGNGSATPLIRAIELMAPRQSSLAFLPPLFQEEPVSAHFLDRFLSYFDTLFAELESHVDSFADRLAPLGVPAGPFLSWLASWFDIRFLAEWPEGTRREFVRRAMDLHRTRGTVAGLRALIGLHSGLEEAQIVLIEHFRLRAMPPSLHIAGQPLDPPDSERAHHFTVVLPAIAAPEQAARETLNRLLDEWKPAHTVPALRLVEPGIWIGCQSTIGVDMIIGGPEAAPLGEARLGQSTFLAGRPHPPRLGHATLH